MGKDNSPGWGMVLIDLKNLKQNPLAVKTRNGFVARALQRGIDSRSQSLRALR
jgi:hypothetical protein